MMKFLAILVFLFVAGVVSASFIEKTITTGEATLSTLSTSTQNGTGFPVFNSSNASDNSSKTIYLTYVDSSGNFRTTSSALNGTTAVTSTANATYLVSAWLSSAAAGSVTVKNDAGTTIFTIPIGATSPTDNGASPFCYSTGGCTLTNMMYGGDAMFRLRFNASDSTGASRTVFTTWAAAGQMSNFGSGAVRWKFGERLNILATPYENNTNMSLYFEGD